MNGLGAGYGEVILLRHPDGSTTFYAHLDRRLVGRGQLVQGGEVIGLMGNTSRAAAPPRNQRLRGTGHDPRTQGYPIGPHLHMSIHGVADVSLIPVDYRGPHSDSGKLPARPPRRVAVVAYEGADLISMATDRARGEVNEHDWGVDPVRYLQSVGMSLFAAHWSRR